MPRESQHRSLTIDARPRGPRGPMAGVELLGRPVLSHLLDLASGLGESARPVAVHARRDEHEWLNNLIASHSASSVVFATGPPPEGSMILRADRIYDPRRLQRVVRRGRDPEAAVIWRLDGPHGLAGAEAELVRRRCYQPIGRFWAVGLARALASKLAPTRVRPHALTVGCFGAMVVASGVVASGVLTPITRWGVAVMLAVALLLDATDGLLARRQGTASALGRWLDTILDETGEMVLHASIAWAAFARSGSPAWLGVGMLYAMGKYLFCLSNDEWDRAARGLDRAPAVSSARLPADAEPRPTSLTWWGRRLGHSDVRWHLWIVCAASGRLDWALAAFAVYFPVRTIAGAIRKVARHGA